MADTIFSVRVDEEVKSKFNEIAKKLGINNKEFMEELISSYELYKVSEECTVNVQSDINELQHITKRMIDIYVNLIDGMKAIENEKEDKQRKALEEKQIEINNLKVDLEKQKQSEEKLLNKIEDISKELNLKEQKLKERENVNNNFKDLKVMLEEKIIDLESKLKDTHNSILELETLKKQIKDNDEEKKHLINLMNNYKEENEKLKSNLENENKRCEDIKINLKNDYEKQINLIKQKVELEKNTVILELREKHYEKLYQLQENLNKQISNLIEQNSIANSRIKELENTIKQDEK